MEEEEKEEAGLAIMEEAGLAYSSYANTLYVLLCLKLMTLFGRCFHGNRVLHSAAAVTLLKFDL